MSTETEGSDFAAFEAQANEPVTEQPKDDPKPAEEAEAKDDTLELTDGDEAVEADEHDETAEEDTDKDGKKRRSKPASQRIAEITAKLRNAERELEAYKNPPANDDKAEAPVEPNANDFEFGEADPEYIKALIKHERAAAKHEAIEEAKQDNAKRAWQDKITNGVAKAEIEAKAKYADFDDKLSAAVEARGGDPLHPLLTLAVSMSPVGADVLYRFATDTEAVERMEELAKGGASKARALAMVLGELEGDYLPDTADDDLDLADSEDMARMMGRMRARLKSAHKPAQSEKPTVAVTNAPEPPAHTARGAGGRYEVTGDTTDFAAFERKANGR